MKFIFEWVEIRIAQKKIVYHYFLLFPQCDKLSTNAFNFNQPKTLPFRRVLRILMITSSDLLRF